KDDLPRFGRRERLAELEQEYLRLQKELETVRERKNSETAEAARLRARLVETESKLESARDERVSAEKEAAEIGATINSLQADEKRLSKDKSAAAVSLEALKQRQYTLSLDVDQLSSEKERLVSDLGERSAALSQFETAAQGAAEELNKKRVALVETRSRTQQLVDRIRHQQELRTEISQTIRNKTSENERALTEIESSVSEITVLEKRLESVLQERAGLSEKESELRQRRDSVVGSLRERESESRDVRSRKERTVNETHVLELRFAQIENERSNILGRMREEYDIQPETFSFSFSGDSSHGADQFDTEEKRLTGNEQIEALKQKLKSHGAVNLLAIEEYDSATERFDFLSRQLEDLTQAKATLQSTINKINATARELFNETFGKARDNFRDIFTELFDGGECDIRLTDASNPLESEIEIIAKPKGKKLVTITQMSGGERALTAISLLFSLYLVKPSPFCILDEIDAPLDDANCHRFLKLIRRFSNQTQFIVITHNKITMEAADTLYGVTMESPGVSKLVSVRFGEVDEEGRVSLSRAEVPDAAEEIASDETEVEVPAAVVERLAPTVGASDRTAE
ncbi:MAG: AAA family ATPase, partial [Candidatus Zixiibacteriota bacterium]